MRINLYNNPLALTQQKIQHLAQLQASKPQASLVDEVFALENGNILQIEGDTAMVCIRGLITQRPCWEQIWMGGVTTYLIHEAITKALSDNSIRQIVLDIDSPGGEVAGIDELSNFIFESRGKKEIVSVCNSEMSSAAYWIGSAASKIFLSGKGAIAGSIGVVWLHVDISQQLSDFGVKINEIVAGKYKRAASQYKALDDFGKGTLQEKVDYIYSIFVSAVARNRGTSDEDVLSRMADGRLFIGEQIIAAGLADGLLNQIIPKGKIMPMITGNATASDQKPKSDEKDDRIAELEKENEELRKQIEDLKQSDEEPSSEEDKGDDENTVMEEEKKEEAAKSYAMGVKAERSRLAAIDEISIPGYEKIVAKAKTDGWSADKTAAEILKSQKSRGTSLDSIKSDSQNVPFLGQSVNVDENTKRTQMAAMIAGKVKI